MLRTSCKAFRRTYRNPIVRMDRKTDSVSVPGILGRMSPEALSELIFNIANTLVSEGKAGTLTADLIPPQAKFAVMRPKDRAHGDWASNAAMQLAKKAGMKPRDFAELFAAELTNADGIKSVEVAGPGFINITLDSASAAAVVDTVLEAGSDYGKNDHLSGKTLNLEFVSANPTGPIHIGGTRWAAVGDSMARVLEANGAKVVREYYFNDHGEQINRFAKSLVAAAHGEETPIDGYKGAYIDEIAKRVIDEANADGVDVLSLPRVDGGADQDGNPLGEGDSEQREEFRKRAVPMMFDEIQQFHEELPRQFRRVVPREQPVFRRRSGPGHRRSARPRRHLRKGRRHLVRIHQAR